MHFLKCIRRKLVIAVNKPDVLCWKAILSTNVSASTRPSFLFKLLKCDSSIPFVCVLLADSACLISADIINYRDGEVSELLHKDRVKALLYSLCAVVCRNDNLEEGLFSAKLISRLLHFSGGSVFTFRLFSLILLWHFFIGFFRSFELIGSGIITSIWPIELMLQDREWAISVPIVFMKEAIHKLVFPADIVEADLVTVSMLKDFHCPSVHQLLACCASVVTKKEVGLN